MTSQEKNIRKAKTSHNSQFCILEQSDKWKKFDPHIDFVLQYSQAHH